MSRWLIRLLTHGAALAIGFAAGIYVLPIITAPPAPDARQVEVVARNAPFSGSFRKDLRGSDLLHWGDGEVWVGRRAIAFKGSLAPGPDYKLYLVPKFIQTETEFEQVRNEAVRVGDVKTFDNFIVQVPANIDVSHYTTVLVWCESFSQFISAAQYR